MAPRFELVAPILSEVERFRPELLVVEVVQGERPLRGLLEQVDWRLCGLISRAMARGRITGELGEMVLVGAGRHLRSRYLVLIGLGARDQANSLNCNRLLDDIMAMCDGLKVESVALPLPGRSTGNVRPATAGQLLNIRVGERGLRAIAMEQEELHAEVAAALVAED